MRAGEASKDRCNCHQQGDSKVHETCNEKPDYRCHIQSQSEKVLQSIGLMDVFDTDQAEYCQHHNPIVRSKITTVNRGKELCYQRNLEPMTRQRVSTIRFYFSAYRVLRDK